CSFIKMKEFRRMALTFRIRELVNRGLIDKERSTRDERIVYIKLSTEGLIMFSKIKDKVESELKLEKMVKNYIEEFQDKLIQQSNI
ncbi:transcriptional regulator, SarA/Rot family, partial [Macrococcus capreoli]|uniref:transcriptional regulator, SarA/Rot family n=1 Tax=Macrococcus capreoli TaxID=2982690 RepID=UPI003EE7BAFC